MSKKVKMDVDYFINKFEAIPDELWTTNQYHDNGKSCAMGHCGATERMQRTEESAAFEALFVRRLLNIPCINDGQYSQYPQPTPKARILAALSDIKQRG